MAFAPSSAPAVAAMLATSCCRRAVAASFSTQAASPSSSSSGLAGVVASHPSSSTARRLRRRPQHRPTEAPAAAMRASFLHTSAPPPRLRASSSLSAATTTPASPYVPPPYSSSSSSPSSSSPSDPQLGAVLYEPEPAKVTSHLNALLEGLQPPLSPELATRMVTHKGAISPNADAARSQHNAKLSFLGRRILRLYLSIFYHAHASLLEQARDQRHANPNFPTPASSTLASLKLCEATLEEALDSRALGRYVGSRWELEDNMVWRAMTGRDGRPTGLTKISGQAVEAIIGGVFRQYGAATALQVFNSRILPFLPLPQELRGPAVQLAKAHGDLSATAQEANDEQAEGVKEE